MPIQIDRSLRRGIHRRRPCVSEHLWLQAAIFSCFCPGPLGAAETAPKDRYGDPLPRFALARMGSMRLRQRYGAACLSFSPDGSKLISAGATEGCQTWDVKTGRRIGVLSGFPDLVSWIDHSPDGKTLAVGMGRHKRQKDGTYLDSGALSLWDISGRKIRHSLKGHAHSGDVMVAIFSPDGRTILSGSRDKTVRLWSAATGEHLRTYRGHAQRILELAFSPDGSLIASAGTDQTIRIWETKSGRTIGVVPDQFRIRCLAISSDNTRLASGDMFGVALIWDIQAMRKEGSGNAKPAAERSPAARH